MAVISNNASSAQILFAAEVFTRNDDLPVISFGLTRQILQICLCFAVLIPFGFQNQAKNLLVRVLILSVSDTSTLGSL